MMEFSNDDANLHETLLVSALTINEQKNHYIKNTTSFMKINFFDKTNTRLAGIYVILTMIQILSIIMMILPFASQINIIYYLSTHTEYLFNSL